MAACIPTEAVSTYPRQRAYSLTNLLSPAVTHCLDGSDEDPKFCAGYKCSTDGAAECPGPGKQCIAPVSTRFEHDETWKSKFRKFQDYRRQLSWMGSIPKGKVSTICDGEVNCEVRLLVTVQGP